MRALTSEGVLDAKEHIQKLQALHPYEDPPMMPDSLDSMHGDSSSHEHNPSPLQASGGLCQECKAKESSRCTRQRVGIIKQMNLEAVNAICKLCKRRIAANHQFIPEHLRPFFFGARLIPIAKKDGGIRPMP